MSWRRRLAPALLLLGLGLGGAHFSRAWPRDTPVSLRIDGDRAAVRRLEVAFASQGSGDGEGDWVAGGIWTFPTGAPLVVRTTPHLPPGEWNIALLVELEGGRRHEIKQKTLLAGDPVRISIHLPDAPDPGLQAPRGAPLHPQRSTSNPLFYYVFFT